jgi:hypothetical protein
MCQTRDPQRSVLAGALAVLVAASVGACGTNTQGLADGGDAKTGPRSFDMVAALSLDGSAAVPPTSKFTLVLDAAPDLAIVGANGRGALIGVMVDDGRRYVLNQRFWTQINATDACGKADAVHYDDLDVIASNGGLIGSATGSASLSYNDSGVLVPISATVTGSSDQTPPTLDTSGPLPATPFDTFALTASEPLPMTAAARLVAYDGTTIPLTPTVVTGVAVSLVLGFTKPDVVLRAGQSYDVVFDGLVDFAGLVAPPGSSLRLVSFPVAPVVPTDGFESAAGDVLAGAMVVRSGGSVPVISGDASLYIGGPGAPFLDAPDGRTLLLKVARQNEETTLHFGCRVLAWQADTTFAGSLQMGSEGGSPGPVLAPFVATATTEMATTVAGQTVYLSDAVQVDLALPTDATDEVLLRIAPTDTSCAPVAAPSAGLVIDDLRLE